MWVILPLSIQQQQQQQQQQQDDEYGWHEEWNSLINQLYNSNSNERHINFGRYFWKCI
jgi:hypothetical protein